VRSYFETDEGIQVDLAEDAKTWLIRDDVLVEVEAGEEAELERGSLCNSFGGFGFLRLLFSWVSFLTHKRKLLLAIIQSTGRKR